MLQKSDDRLHQHLLWQKLRESRCNRTAVWAHFRAISLITHCKESAMVRHNSEQSTCRQLLLSQSHEAKIKKNLLATRPSRHLNHAHNGNISQRHFLDTERQHIATRKGHAIVTTKGHARREAKRDDVSHLSQHRMLALSKQTQARTWRQRERVDRIYILSSYDVSDEASVKRRQVIAFALLCRSETWAARVTRKRLSRSFIS